MKRQNGQRKHKITLEPPLKGIVCCDETERYISQMMFCTSNTFQIETVIEKIEEKVGRM